MKTIGYIAVLIIGLGFAYFLATSVAQGVGNSLNASAEMIENAGRR